MSEAQSRGDYRHVIDLAVRWGDVDMLGHVHNARYFTYTESARIATSSHGSVQAPGRVKAGVLFWPALAVIFWHNSTIWRNWKWVRG